jgi:cell division protein FtsL
MLPLSMGRPPVVGSERRELYRPLEWRNPANVASAASAELRALVAWMAVFVAIGVVIALVHVWLRLKVVDLGYRLGTTSQVIERLKQEGSELTLQVAALSAPSRLDEVARTRLGMMRPEKGQEAVLP